ncbi:phosphorothioated DNA-binding restriction endonuclease [Actinocorallia populi]|uniref:phosphorothioated DNA-binding restriction endonuclease n=1 Tax=Actinocorallia populi TaxID=2079200 RepID=UPI000D0866C9|nr:HNH endonuclease [Actinocorallia populi]
MSLVERIMNIRMWQQNGRRAPHKPLLLLYALARFQREGEGPILYSAAEKELAELIRDFGPPGAAGPYYPFDRLANDDDLWTVATGDGLPSPGDSPVRLRETGAVGRFTPSVVAELRTRPEKLLEAARALLDANFPESLHESICDAVGLDLHRTPYVLRRVTRPRDPAFRRAVLNAYAHRCAFCDYEGRLAGTTVGLDAAHIRWFAFDGPDTLDNSLCLCSLHHVLFDKGVLTLTHDHRVRVTDAFTGGTPTTRAQVHALAGRPVAPPVPALASAHLTWHHAQVFHGAA